MNGSCSHTQLIFILLALTLFFTTQSKQSHHLESYLDSSSWYNVLITFKLPYGNTTVTKEQGNNKITVKQGKNGNSSDTHSNEFL